MKRFLSIFTAAVICSAMTSNAYAAVEFLEPEPVEEPIEIVEEVKEDPFKPSETNPLVIYQSSNMNDIVIKWVPDTFTEEIIIYVYDEKRRNTANF